MGFITICIFIIVFSISINYICITIINYLYKNQINLKWYKHFFINRLFSWFIFFAVSFNYPEFFIYYFIEKATTPFLIADANTLAFHLFQNVSFFSWIFYFPFLIQGSAFRLKPLFIYSEYLFYSRLSLYIIYIHFLSIFITHFDLFYFFQDYSNSIIGSWFERSDYSAYLAFYKGTVFDIYVILSIFWGFFIVSIFLKHKTKVVLYYYKSISNAIYEKRFSFWNSFYFLWIVRFFLYFFIFYFFIGESFFSDFLVIIFSIVFMEISLIFFRLISMTYSWCSNLYFVNKSLSFFPYEASYKFQFKFFFNWKYEIT